MSDIKKLIRPYCYKIIPLIYDDSLSYYEVLCKLREKINEIIETLNLNYDVSEKVNEILNKWLEDGTLAEMIDSALDNVQVITPEYIITTCRKDGRYDNTIGYSVLQSFCFLGSEVGVALYGQPDGASVYDGNNCKLIKFNPKTGKEIGYATTIEAGHGNDIATDGEKIYIAWMCDNGGSASSYSNNKIVVTDSNFNYLYTLRPNGIPYVGGIDYNPETELFYLFCEEHLYVYDRTLSVLQKTIALNFDYYRRLFGATRYFGAQTITTLDEGFMVNYAHPNVCFKFDESGNIQKIYNIENYENGFNNLEIEKVAYNRFDHYFYISSFARGGLGDFANNVYGRFNLKKGQVKYINPIRTTRQLFYASDLVFYVDPTVDDNEKMLGTVEFPFKYMQQALDCLNNSRYKCGRIFLLERGQGINVGTVAISGISNIHIASQNNCRINIPNIRVVHADNIEIYYADIAKARFNNNGSIRLGNVNISSISKDDFSRNNMVFLDNTSITGSRAVLTGFVGRTRSDNNINFTQYSTCYDIGTIIS